MDKYIQAMRATAARCHDTKKLFATARTLYVLACKEVHKGKTPKEKIHNSPSILRQILDAIDPTLTEGTFLR